MLLNQGGGAFTALTPVYTTGNDRVTAINPRRGGRAQFRVQNGEGHEPGPVQVIAYR